MAKINKYANRSKISKAKLRQFLKLFSFDLDASQIAMMTGLNRNTVKQVSQPCANESLSTVSDKPQFSEKSKLMKVTSGHVESRDSEVVAQAVKPLFLHLQAPRPSIYRDRA
jgi:hypothetical protein